MAEIPTWFADAFASPYDTTVINVDGCPIQFLRWGKRGLPGLVLVHGAAAHAQWWRFLAPFFAEQYDVVALDLSGHGDSGWRTSYARTTWVAEVMSVIAAARFPAPPIVLGHSLGGLVTAITAAQHGTEIAGAIIVDAPAYLEEPDPRIGRGARAAKVYPDVDTALRAFRLVPAQPCDNAFVVDAVARASLRETEGGLTWKFDPLLFGDPFRDQLADYLQSIRCRVAVLRGEHSVVVPRKMGDILYDMLGRVAPVIEIPDAYHHLILDQPLAFVAATRALLAIWQHPSPTTAPARAARGAS